MIAGTAVRGAGTVFLLALLGASPPPADPAPATLVAGARVFDGTGAKARIEDVLIRGDRIVAVGRNLAVPADATRIDGTGKTLIPGLHDLHTHLRSRAYDAPEDLGKSYAGYLLAGITTVNDYSVSGEMIAPIRAMTSFGPHGEAPFLWAPHLNEAVRMGVPGGHGTEFGWGNFFTLQVATPRAAHGVMPLALSYDPDVIKVFADGWRYDRDPDLMSMNEPTLAAIVEDAHAAHKPVITHTVTYDGATIGAEAGIDAVGHGVGDRLIDRRLIDLMHRSHMAYIATLVVFEPLQRREFSPGEWTEFNPGEKAAETARPRSPDAPMQPYDTRRWEIMQRNIRTLKKAHIPIGIGTDAGIVGVYHGPGAIREITWLTRLGYTPAQALVAATSTSAAIIDQQADHGTIEPGKRADLVLIDGRPDKAIEDLWKVSRVWLSGHEVPLAKMRAILDSPDPTPMPVENMPGPIMTGLRSDGRTDLDTLPVESTDPGIDHSSMIALDKTPDPGTFLAAQMGAAPKPFVEWVLPLTRGTIDVADASRFAGVTLHARGSGQYRLVLESYGLTGRQWFGVPFSANDAGITLRIPFSAFRSADPNAVLDLKALRALRVELSGKTGGKASLELGQVRFY